MQKKKKKKTGDEEEKTLGKTQEFPQIFETEDGV